MSSGDKFWYFVGLALSSPANVLGLFLLLMVTLTLLWAQLSSKSKIDLTYLLVDPATGNVTLAKFGGFGAFVASTWVLVVLATGDHFSEGYASVYLLTWGAVKVASDIKLARESSIDEPVATVRTKK